MLSAALVAIALAGPATASVKNNGTTTSPIKAGTEFRVTGRTGNEFSGEVYVDRFVVEKGAMLRVQSTAVATPAPMAILMVHARIVEIKGDVEMSAGGWGQIEVERKIVLSGSVKSGDTARFRINGCPRAEWTVEKSFQYSGSQPVDLYGTPLNLLEGPLKGIQRNHMTCEQLMPGRTPMPKGMAGKVKALHSSFNGGRVKQGTELLHEFVVKNVGTETLWVGNAKTS